MNQAAVRLVNLCEALAIEGRFPRGPTLDAALAARVAGPADEGLRAAAQALLIAANDLTPFRVQADGPRDAIGRWQRFADAREDMAEALDAAAGCLPEDENQARITVKAVYEFGTHGERRWTLVEAPRPTPEQALAETELSFPVPRLRVGDKDPT